MESEEKFNNNLRRVLEKIKLYALDFIEYRTVEYPIFTEHEFDVADEEKILDSLITNGVLEHTQPVRTIIVSEKDPYLQQNIYDFWVNKKLFLELYEKLGKNVLDKRRGKLLISNDGQTTYTSVKGTAKTAKFNKNTSEYLILDHLAMNPGIAVETTRLIDKLKTNRNNADYADPKQRVLDKIKAIRKKLGNEIITTTPNGYILDCEVVRM